MNFKLGVVPQQKKVTFIAPTGSITGISPALLGWTEGRAGRVCGCANDRCWFH